ncbi:MAG: hypothetical protein JW854_05305 [Actinobacteria bacterium]|nr:hypothetical protein [Actinomycetota bacterium]
MSDKEKDAQQPDGKAAKKKSAGAKKPAAKKPAKKKSSAAAKKPAAAAQKPPTSEEPKSEPEEKRGPETAEEKPAAEAAEEKEDGISEEEFRRMVEESLEKVTVADIILNMMNDLASLAYMKMGLPESVNLKYRDLDQASLAIDTLEAIIKAAEGRVSPEHLQPFRGTLANMQMNFVQLRRG